MKSRATSFLCTLCIVLATVLTAAIQADAQVWLVDKSATGANDGSSWQDAFTEIQPAIDAAFIAGGGEVWVAGSPLGVVYDEARTELWGGPTAYAGSLVMKDNVHVYGGFEGWSNGAGQLETALSQRAPGINVTVIDGSTSRAGSPAYHVVVFGRGSSATVNSRLDGFQITGGDASGVVGDYHTYRGGGIYNWRSAPIIANCRIYGNTASVSGGGVANEGISGAPANAQYINCVIDDNIANRNIDWQSNPARGGAGVFNNQSSPSLTHVTISNNITGAGGALPGMPNFGLNSGGIYNVAVAGLPAAAPVLLSGIVWANTGTNGIINEAITGAVVAMTATFSDIAGGYAGAGNINANPNFVGANPFPYQINSAPCLDAGSSAINEDIRLVPRPIGAGRDMGAYEYSPNGPVAVCAPHTVNLDASCAATMTAANIGGGSSAEAAIYKLTASQTDFDSADIPSVTVTLTVTDRLGRTDSCNTTVNVLDPIDPVITFCPGDPILNLDINCQVAIPDLASLVSATDNCGIASITQMPLAGTLVSADTPVIMTVTDVGGNAVQCSATVTVVDVIVPVAICQDITVNLSSPIFDTLDIDGGSFDECGITAYLLDGENTAAITVYCTDMPDMAVTLTVEDAFGNADSCVATVTVVDDILPVISLIGDDPVTIECSEEYTDAGATAEDNCDGDLTDDIEVDNPVNTSLAGTYVVTYDVVDSSNNAAVQVTRTVIVVDTIVPDIALFGPEALELECGVQVYTELGAFASDACDGDLTGDIVITNTPGNSTTLGVQMVTYTVEDAVGNSASIDREVTVVDTTSPLIALLGSDPVVLTHGGDYVEAGATAWDDCEGDLSGAVNILDSVPNTDVVAMYIINYEVSDSSENSSSTTRTVYVKPASCVLDFALDITPNPAVPGTTVALNVVEQSGSCNLGTLNYSWQYSPVNKAFTAIPGAPNAATYVINSVAFSDAGIYKCTVSDAIDSTDTNEVTLDVQTGIPVTSMTGMLLAAAAAALAGVATLRKRK